MRPLVLIAMFATLSLSAQEKLVESIEVRVVNVDVVVTDRDGRPVTGLTANDFEILEDKRQQAITNFSEIRDGRAAQEETSQAAVKPRHFILFVDNRAMHPVLRKHVTSELHEFLDAQVRPTDQATVISWDRVLNIVAPLTSNKSVLHAALDKVANTGAPTAAKSDFARLQQKCMRILQLSRSGRLPARMAYEECIGEAKVEAQRLMLFSRSILNAVDVAMSTVAGLEGRKILVMSGTEMPVKPGLDMYRYANNLFTPYLRGSLDAAIDQPSQEDERAQREMLEKLARSANAHGVTLYMISALMPADPMSLSVATGVDSDASELLRSGNTEVAHETLATLTGGVAAPISRLGAILETIATDLASYYSLGYRPVAAAKGDRRILVRAKNRAYVVRARQTHAAKSFDEQMADRVVANIFTPAQENEWKVELRTGAPQFVEEGKYSVPVEIIAPATVTLLPQGGELAGGFTVFVAVGNAQGALSTTFRQPNSIRIAAGEESGFRGEPLVFTATLTLREGENLLSVGLLDQVSNSTGFARTTVVAASK